MVNKPCRGELEPEDTFHPVAMMSQEHWQRLAEVSKELGIDLYSDAERRYFEETWVYGSDQDNRNAPALLNKLREEIGLPKIWTERQLFIHIFIPLKVLVTLTF